MNITIPEIPLPFDIPLMIHPLIVHFAIALPIVLLILELINTVARRRLLGGINLFFMLLIVLVTFGAYLTGTKDASDLDLQALEAHKQLGVYLVYGSVVLLFFKLVSSIVDKIQVKIFFYIALIAFISTAFIEGKRGGELVYKYGVNVKSEKTISTPTKEGNQTKSEDINSTQTEQNSTADNLNKTTQQEQNKTKATEQNSTEINQTQEQNSTTVIQTQEQNKTDILETNKTLQKEQNATVPLKKDINKSKDDNQTVLENLGLRQS